MAILPKEKNAFNRKKEREETKRELILTALLEHHKQSAGYKCTQISRNTCPVQQQNRTLCRLGRSYLLIVQPLSLGYLFRLGFQDVVSCRGTERPIC